MLNVKLGLRRIKDLALVEPTDIQVCLLKLSGYRLLPLSFRALNCIPGRRNLVSLQFNAARCSN